MTVAGILKIQSDKDSLTKAEKEEVAQEEALDKVDYMEMDTEMFEDF